ncbi:carboxylesterase/lipase family protein [Aquabacterium sp. J223]|uniref:carboxylesterase/lipase family protein n=1 Tax=Aquabacterium sp. J223 TaxID=2898431 RepID=UPI0021AD6CDD|nr:carboxylesterase family protein [Aquabacterium sp. J223]UUX97080.1 carboxylesterase family protein [Aquabacterium sp. J223]
MSTASSRRLPGGARSFAWLLSGLAAGLLAGCAARAPLDAGAARCDAAGPDIACTTEGAVRGVREGPTLAFKGLPYAAPPVGPLRWQPPAPPARWTGVRDGSRFGAVCPQLAGDAVTGDEDCLSVNVWRPAEPSAAAAARPLPVMVFLPGGGNHSYSGQGAGIFGGVSFDGEALVPQGVVVVTFNQRLGALGFLTHPALRAADGQAGNYGSLDQIAVLRWLQRNAAAFGGDPQRVMLFGTSAGGGSICALMTAPAARGLFHRAAMQSAVPTGCELATREQAEALSGRPVAERLGCDGRPDAAACLRAKPVAEVVRALPGTFGVLPRLYGPNVDGVVFPEQPLAVIARGAHAAMPVIVGNSTLETQLFVGGLGVVDNEAAYAAALRRVFGDAEALRIVGAYPPSAHASPRQALVRLTTDAFFTCQSRRVARLLAGAQRQPVYRYLFDHALENDPELKAQGAVHTVEHPFFFGWKGRYRPTADDLAVQRLVVGHWADFAVDGTPRRGWPRAYPGDVQLRIAAQPASHSGDGGAQCAFWDTVVLPSPHL